MREPRDFESLLQENTSDVSCVRLGRADIRPFAVWLEKNTTLEKLSLSGSTLGPEGALMIVAALKMNSTLIYLDLTKTALGSGAVFIAEALQRNTTLHTLVLSQNNLAMRSAAALAEMLQTNTGLHTLDLSANNLGPRGAICIAEALKINSSLHTLNLEKNKLGAAGIASLAEALQTNTALQALRYLDDEALSEDVQADAGMAQYIADLLHRNRQLQEDYQDAFPQIVETTLTNLPSALVALIQEYAAGEYPRFFAPPAPPLPIAVAAQGQKEPKPKRCILS